MRSSHQSGRKLRNPPCGVWQHQELPSHVGDLRSYWLQGCTDLPRVEGDSINSLNLDDNVDTPIFSRGGIFSFAFASFSFFLIDLIIMILFDYITYIDSILY